MISLSRLKPHDSSFHPGEQRGPGCPEAAAEDRACTLVLCLEMLTATWWTTAVIVLLHLCLPGDGEAQPASETPPCWSEELPSGSKRLSGPGPQSSRGSLRRVWPPTSTPGSHACSFCLTSEEVSSVRRQIYSDATLLMPFPPSFLF